MDKHRLINAGYKQYHDAWNHAKYLMQKKVSDEHGVKYFINIYAYERNGKENFQPEIQFSEGKYPTTNVTLITEDLNVLEGMFEALWVFLDKPYYELN